MIRYVKDKNNVLSFNAGSGSDYLRNINEWAGKYNIFSSTNQAKIGNASFMLTYYGSTTWNSMIVSELTEGSYTFECDIYSPECTCDISIISKEGDSTITTNKVVSTVNSEWQHITINNSITEGQYFQLFFVNNSGTTNNKAVYIDNISLIRTG